LLTNKRRILKITDFGFAKNLDDVDFELVCGSPLYMAPELIRDKKCSEGADLWSIGLILYQMLYGFHPFSHCRNIKELFDSVSNTLIEITPKENISKEAIELMDSLLKKKQSNRIKWEELFNHKWITIKPQRKYSFEDSDKAEKSDKPDKDESEMVKSTVDTYVSTRTKSKPIPIGGKRRSYSHVVKGYH
jgi:serine/threonine-protein kinase ULK/ATG1